MFALRNRRGAVAIFGVLLFLTLTIMMAVAVDLSRLFYVRNELQTAADAAAMAGAIELLSVADNAPARAKTYGERNPALNESAEVPIENVTLGRWVDGTFIHPASAADADAVRVTAVRTPPQFLVARIFGLTPPTLSATAIAWARLPIGQTSACIKPFAIPYTVLTNKLNVLLGTSKPLHRDLDQDDINKLNELTRSGENKTLLQFNLHSSARTQDADIPGNFYQVDLPSFWRSETQDYRRDDDGNPVQPPRGADAYKDNIANCSTDAIGEGDSLYTFTGVAVGPTLQGMNALCGGPCGDHDGGLGYPIIASFWTAPAVHGKSAVAVKQLASFRLTGVGPAGQDGAKITGYFEELSAPGSPTGGTSTIVKPILVR